MNVNRRYEPGRGVRLAIALAFLLVAAAPGAGQTPTLRDDPFDSSYLEPFPDPDAGRREPRLTVRLRHEIALPGPLSPSGPLLRGESIEVPLQEGTVRCDWREKADALVAPGAAPNGSGEANPAWNVAPDGRYRGRISADGRLEVQKRCKRCRAGWRTSWRLRVAGAGLPPPLVTATHVYHGALDNRVYGLKRKNGHRIWETDAEGRLARPLALWRPASKENPGKTGELVLVVPEHGEALLALDALTGAKVASYTLPEDGGKLIGAPIATPDGAVVVARQRYAPGDASLMVFDLVPPAKPPPAGPASQAPPKATDAPPGV